MKAFYLLLFSTISSICAGQMMTARHAVSGEVFGLGLLVSARYDYLFLHTPNGFFDVSGGIGTYAGFTPGGFSQSMSFSYNKGKERHFLELGTGFMFLQEHSGILRATRDRSVSVFTPLMVGYKSIARNGFQFRIYATVFRFPDGQSGGFYIPYGGVGFGKVFGSK